MRREPLLFCIQRMRHVAYNCVRWPVELAIVIFQSIWTIIFGTVDSLDLLWVDMAGVCRGHSLQVAFERVVCLFTAWLPLCWLLWRRRIHPHPCQNDRAYLKLDRMVRLFRIWEIGRPDDLFLIPCKIHRILHLIHRYINQFYPQSRTNTEFWPGCKGLYPKKSWKLLRMKTAQSL